MGPIPGPEMVGLRQKSSILLAFGMRGGTGKILRCQDVIGMDSEDLVRGIKKNKTLLNQHIVHHGSYRDLSWLGQVSGGQWGFGNGEEDTKGAFMEDLRFFFSLFHGDLGDKWNLSNPGGTGYLQPTRTANCFIGRYLGLRNFATVHLRNLKTAAIR